MSVPEKTNRLLHEIKEALPYWEGKKGEWEKFDDDERNQEQMIGEMIDRDEEVREAFGNLIKAIQEEG